MLIQTPSIPDFALTGCVFKALAKSIPKSFPTKPTLLTDTALYCPFSIYFSGGPGEAVHE